VRLPALMKDFMADMAAYMRHSSTSGFSSQDQVLARITATYHNIEKGLSLPCPRPGFGAKNLRLLLDLLRTPGLDRTADPVVTAQHVLAAYLAFNARAGCTDIPYAAEIGAAAADLPAAPERGGLRAVTKAQIEAATAGVTDRFFLERHSVRRFSGTPVDISAIEGAVTVALKAPAVCNRQNSFVYVADKSELKQRLLALQGGSRGFGEGIDKLLIVTTRLSNFWGSGERHQAWVDGGLFAMALIYGLHARALGTVALNWSRTAEDTATLRHMVGMADDEIVILMIGVGQLPEQFEVPVSHRRSAAHSLKIIERMED
jgi:nitroreductase